MKTADLPSPVTPRYVPLRLALPCLTPSGIRGAGSGIMRPAPWKNPFKNGVKRLDERKEAHAKTKKLKKC